MIIWTAGHNMPGYLPEGDVVGFSTRLEALAYTVEELRRVADMAELEDEVADYEEAADALEGRDADTDGDWYETFEDGRIAYWFQAVDLPDNEAREALEGVT